ncbi:nucleic acid-binding protein [Streptomyces sp. S3(2020)]|uniref:nucleic acid-binding protein n=1 Tax=Streptomyces sp. S3(2020) TaxID=2732044 RepID=UPI0014879088|nr:nucleic acid-binding protein [Streptomyces sp. S3(2020)]NNN31883.1 nucleic acid-binding protein [Streptomyces sp. S3(2020)]
MSHHCRQNPREPDDLLTAQRDLQAVRADLAALYTALPYSVEPIEAWARPEGYWLSTSPAHPDSPGWTDTEQQQVADLRERERVLAAAIVTHGFWGVVDGPERSDARSGLRHAALTAAAVPGSGEQEA